MDRIRGVVERITFRNEENGYSVIKCSVKGFQDLVTVVGNMPEAHVGAVLSLTGNWKVDSRYGQQFALESYEETLPATVYGIEKYLGSGLIRGIGPKYARRIVQTFGADTLRMIEEDPDALIQVPGIGHARVNQIKKSWEEQKEIKNIMIFLQGHDVSTALATRIYKQYGAESIQTVKDNPFRLADDIWGIGFKTADTIAGKLGFEKNAFARLRGGLLYSLNRLAEEGHCYAMRDQLLETGARLLTIETEELEAALDLMIQAEDVIVTAIPDTEDYAIYLPPFYYAEIGVRNRLAKILETPPLRQVQGGLALFEEIEYDEVQQQAIQTAMSSKIMILTGGPGTGKSTTTLGILRAFTGLRILLAAPTGRAAKRLAEVTGMEAKTIHRLLEYKPPEGYGHREDTPLEGDVLIVDECSMVDLLLMNALLRAVPDDMRLILVGDVDQLPSVGAGNVLRDLIDSSIFPVVTLTRIFRQAASSQIITNAHRINRGEYPDLSNSRGTDFFFQNAEEPEKASEMIVELVRSRLPHYYHTDPRTIQVLTPMQRGPVGAAALNQMLQAALNPPGQELSGRQKPELHRGGYVFRPGDKVMQIRNNYDKEVFNGDIGFIQRIDPVERELTILFDDREVGYDVTELDEIVLAYATTVHKAQGAEYPIVVMPVMMTHYMMLQRNLLYTGVTRARRALILIGQKKAVSCCVRTMTVSRRNTLLSERLKGNVSGRLAAISPYQRDRIRRYVCFDVETPNSRNDRMSAIGISVVQDGRIVEEFFSYVNPQEPFDEFNTKLTGISPETVAEAPTFPELWPRLQFFFESGILAAHNAPFDLGVLKKCLEAYGIEWRRNAAYTDTVRIGRDVLPGRGHKLNEMCEYYHLELDHHQAQSDSHACAEIMIRYLGQGVKIMDYVRNYRLRI